MVYGIWTVVYYCGAITSRDQVDGLQGGSPVPERSGGDALRPEQDRGRRR